MSLSMPHPQQPIYANYNAVVNAMQTQQSLPNIQSSGANHIQTRAEVHAEKVPFSNNDSKVSSKFPKSINFYFALSIFETNLLIKIKLNFSTVKFKYRFH